VHAVWQVSGASFLAPENLCKKTCASYMFTLPKFLVQEVVTCKNVISSRSSNQRRSFTTETCLKWNMIYSCQFLAPVSCARKMALKTRSHWQVFWHKKLATETCQSEHGLHYRLTLPHRSEFYSAVKLLSRLLMHQVDRHPCIGYIKHKYNSDLN